MKVNIKLYKYADYKSFLLAYMDSLPNNGRGFMSTLAKICNVHPTFVSQVVKGSKEFSLEQAILLADYFKFSQMERDLWITLISKNKAGSKKLVDYYTKQVELQTNRFLEIELYVQEAKKLDKKYMPLYYSDWKYIAIWLLCGLEHMSTVQDISKALGIPLEVIKLIVNNLIEMGLIIDGPDGLNILTSKTHLGSDNPLVYRHHVNWRNKAISMIENMTNQDLSFTGPHTISEKHFKEVREKILELIEFVSKKVSSSDPEKLVCFNIDYIDIKFNQTRNEVLNDV